MTATMQQLKTPKNKPETIINHTKPNFTSPLDLFIQNNCVHCPNWKGKCRLEDTRGLTPMSLCIALYTSQPPPDLAEIMQKAAETKEIAEKTLKETSAELE
jgi:hypothetical protein